MKMRGMTMKRFKAFMEGFFMTLIPAVMLFAAFYAFYKDTL